MTRDRSDQFADFAARHGLSVEREELPNAPRDVVAPPRELELHTLLTLRSGRADAEPLRMVFVSDAADPRMPSIRDALWWLSSDSWAIEHSGRNPRQWAATYGYPDAEPTTIRLFRLHLRQADSLTELLGGSVYRELLAIYEAEIAVRPQSDR
jgi:hypothetical protein